MKRIGYVCVSPENGEYVAFSLDEPERTARSWTSASDAVGQLITNNAEYFGVQVVEICRLPGEGTRGEESGG